MHARKRIDPKAARMRKSLTRVGLAAAASVGYCTVCRCERDGRWPSRPTTRQRYLAALGLAERDGQVVPTEAEGGAA